METIVINDTFGDTIKIFEIEKFQNSANTSEFVISFSQADDEPLAMSLNKEIALQLIAALTQRIQEMDEADGNN